MPWNAQIGIVGAGPAGALAAELLADQGAEVLLFDDRAPWEKPCGGGLTAGTFIDFPEFVRLQARANRVDVVRFEAGASMTKVPLERPLFVVARSQLAEWQLHRAIRAGVTFIPDRVRQVRCAGRGWKLSTAAHGDVLVRRLVGADGAASRVRKAVASELRTVHAATRVSYPQTAGTDPEHVAVFRFIRGLDGYLWELPRADHSSVGVGALSGRWPRKSLDDEVVRYCAAADEGSPRIPVAWAGASIPVAARPLGDRYATLGAADFALLGDAAGLADPLTGEGIRSALLSADCLGDAYSRDRTFSAYPALLRARLEPDFRASRAIHLLVRKGLLLRLLTEMAARHRVAWAVLASVMNTGNAHDTSYAAVHRLGSFMLT